MTTRHLQFGRCGWASPGPDGTRALSASIYQGLRIWNPKTGLLIIEFEEIEVASLDVMVWQVLFRCSPPRPATTQLLQVPGLETVQTG